MAKQVKQLGIAQNSIGFNDGDKLQKAVDFILDTYDIRKAMYDPAKIYVRYKDKELDEGILDFDRISLDLQEYGISISDTILKKILRSDKYIKAYNPIKEYFDKIRGSFKDPSQIELLSKHLIARPWDDKPEGYYQERAGKLLKKWLVACVACWLGGHQNEVMLTLIQMKEGVGKTYFSEWIVPDCLKEYYVKSKREDRFDMEDAFTRNMIVCFDELVGLTKGTADIFKATIATKNIWVKRRNDEYPIARPRLACAIGTTNRNQELNGFLQECFGYRRFACIELADINREYSKLCDKDLLWAEALMLYENSAFDYIFNQEDFDEFKAYNQRYVVEYPALKYVRLYLARPDGPDEGQMLNPTEICKALRKANKINREDLLAVNPQKVGAALTSLGYIQKSDRSGSTPRYRYHVILNI